MKCKLKAFLFAIVFVCASAYSMQPCESKAYLALKEKALDSLSDDELSLLLDFNENCTEYLGENDYPVSPCNDDIFKKMEQIPYENLSVNQAKFLQVLEEDCNDHNSDIERDRDWKTAKPGVVLGIIGGVSAAVFLFIVVPILSVKSLFESDM